MTVTAPLRLRVMNGALSGTTVRLTEASVIVGRSADCALVVEDPSLSRRHFKIARDGDAWRVIDLESRNGISVNGTSVRQTTVRAGDEIRAGGVIFRLETGTPRISDSAVLAPQASVAPVEDMDAPIELFPSTVPTLSAESPVPAVGSALASLLSSGVPAPSSRLYAVVDGAQAFELAFAARLMGHRLFTLLPDDLALTIAHVGPCLVVIGERSAFLQKWVEEMGTNAGVLLESSAEFEAVSVHLRRVFVSADEDGEQYFFRFYDPRVLGPFLTSRGTDELREFFGPIDRWIVESEDGSAVTAFAIEHSVLVRKELVSTGRTRPNLDM